MKQLAHSAGRVPRPGDQGFAASPALHAFRLYWSRVARSPSYLLLLIAVGLLPFSSIRVRGSLAIGDLFLFAAMAALIFEANLRRVRLWLPWWLMVSTLFIVFGAGLAAAVGDADGNEDIVYFLTYLFCFLLIPFLIASQPHEEAWRIRYVFVVWLLANVVGSVIAILESRQIPLFFLTPWLHFWGNRVSGLTVHPNTLGLYCALAMPAALSMAMASRRTMAFLFWLAAAGSLLYTVDISGSRTALGASLASSVVVIAYYVYYQRDAAALQRLLRIFGVLLAVFIAYYLRPGEHESAFERLFGESISVAPADNLRGYAFDESLRLFWRYPLFGDGYSHILTAHNHFLEVLESGGVFGFIGYLLREAGIYLYALVLVPLSVRRGFDFRIAVGLAAACFVWALSGIKNTALLERDAFVPLGLVVLSWLYLRAQKPMQASKPVASRP